MNKLKNKNVAVLGLGMEGKDLVNNLLNNNHNITVYDAKKVSELDLTGIDKDKVNFVCGSNYLSKGLCEFDTIYRSPGVYRYLKELVKAEEAGVKISSAIKLFFKQSPASIIGVTGTKGKGTTSTLIYKILKNAGKDVYLAGNIGKPILELLPILKKTSWVVLELSSFQLIDLKRSPRISVVLNITSDHMDWHKDQDEYLEAKKNIVKYQHPSDYAVINADYKTSKKFSKITKAHKYYFSKKNKVRGCYVNNKILYLNIGTKSHKIGNTKKLQLRGEHNWENITAAICASKLTRVENDSIRKATFSFKGLEHRLELVGDVNNVKYYNDSFATGPLPTIAAIKSFVEPTILILGGYDKKLEYEELAESIVERKNVLKVILIGDIEEKLEISLKDAGFDNKVIKLGKPKMKKIVSVAKNGSQKGWVVLLSPASASFDMFKDYKERGNLFRQEVNKLKG